jgi:steroid delta-isomerase-like uncharacterized protein
MAAHEAVIGQFFAAFTGRRDVEAAGDVLAEDAVIHQDAMPGPLNKDAYKQVGAMFLAAFGDLGATIEEQIVQGDRVVTRVTWTGTHNGDLAGIPPTGRSFRVTGILIDRIANGQIVERWNVGDQLGMMMQLGLVPAPAGV